jgi:hypothetical protein
MKTTKLKAEITVQPSAKIIALVITMIDSLHGWDREKVLRTVAAHYNLRVVV